MPGSKGRLTPKVFNKVVNNYLEECETKQVSPFKYKLAYILGLTPNQLMGYAKKPAYMNAIKRIEQAGEIALRERVETKNSIGAMFLLKTNYNYSEKQNIDITTGGSPLGIVMLPPKPNRATGAIIEAHTVQALPQAQMG